ncbi:hypothetical protein ACQKJZ_18290 [Sphingomonas sp. NPDC019816]|jgi:hypothetical protein|uniref:DUF465 domain-containing protein n=1 Tax=Alphaproteobacteria TaxID=28211 RepID=UPI000F7DB0E0|nr:MULTISPECIES: DUF465 domain-containing protein [Alphaproteobacteria]MDE0947979.1 DUF465 domain-containing protein [Sphingobium sp.]RSV11664.1 DUF465 domain-containing protein [Sphingomonas sp. ABOLF]TAJ29095.1 MAG: DUF465 domain-containing protein [Bosea sp. (in: a-proteobacteria)]|tara:strand:- start:1404 stop:1589 length:186 start_codon:yes stop_codon:yes gene_type:complete
MTDRSFSLLSRQQRLDEQLMAERARSVPDGMRLFRLQRLKLLIRSRLSRLLSASQVRRALH